METDLLRDRSQEFLPRLASTYTAACFSVLSPILFNQTNPTAPENRLYSIWDPTNSTEEETRRMESRINSSGAFIGVCILYHHRLGILARNMEEASSEGNIEKFIDLVDSFKWGIGAYSGEVRKHKDRRGVPTFLEYPTNPSGKTSITIGRNVQNLVAPINPDEEFLSLDRDLLYLGLAKKDFLRKVKREEESLDSICFGGGDGMGIDSKAPMADRVELVRSALEMIGFEL